MNWKFWEKEENVRYNADYFRNLTKQNEERKDNSLQKEYQELINRIESSIKENKSIENEYDHDSYLSPKIIALLEKDGFKVKDASGRYRWLFEISW